jgi:peptidylprolyl isomerase
VSVCLEAAIDRRPYPARLGLASLSRKRAGGLALSLLLAIAPCARAADSASDTVARLGNTDIPAATIRDFARSLDAATRRQALADPAVMAKLVRQELTRVAVLNEATAKKWDQRPDVAARIAKAREDAIVSSYLASVAALPDGFPSDAQIQAFYEANRDRLMAPRQYHLEQIFVAAPSGGDKKAEDAALAKAEELARKGRTKGANFAEIAKAASDTATGEPAGDVGWAAEAQIVPEIRSQVTGMNPGEISDPIRTGTGWHIIRMVETRPAGPRPLPEVKDQLITALRQAKLQETEQAYISALLEKTPAMINELGLKKVFETAP